MVSAASLAYALADTVGTIVITTTTTRGRSV